MLFSISTVPLRGRERAYKTGGVELFVFHTFPLGRGFIKPRQSKKEASVSNSKKRAIVRDRKCPQYDSCTAHLSIIRLLPPGGEDAGGKSSEVNVVGLLRCRIEHRRSLLRLHPSSLDVFVHVGGGLNGLGLHVVRCAVCVWLFACKSIYVRELPFMTSASSRRRGGRKY